jgi:hypothetical protein
VNGVKEKSNPAIIISGKIAARDEIKDIDMEATAPPPRYFLYTSFNLKQPPNITTAAIINA